jgi:Helix-turn-helix domain
MSSQPSRGDALLEGFLSPSDPRAIRALAHPIRMALIELLVHRGTLTATQASETLGESPANCAFHLRTLAKYGFIEEAGGGRGRERPWRRTHIGLNLQTVSDNPEYSAAVQALEDVALSYLLTRARAALASRASWPAPWQHRLGELQVITYLTPEEADGFSDDLNALLMRYADRDDHPERRPPGAMPVELVTLSYPLLHLPDLTGADPACPDAEN